MSDRRPRIACLDLDTFFVSVERLLDPSLVGRPVIVGAAPGQRGVVLAASYEVRPLGVHSGMSMRDARRLAPHAVYVPPRHDTYTPYARRVRAVLERFTPEVQTASIDEFFLSFHGCERLYRRPGDASDDAALVRVLHRIRAAVRADVGLPCSVGVGCTRTVAKIASGLAKPHRRPAVDDGRGLGSGVVLVPADHERAWLADLPLRRVPGIGPTAEARLLALGLRTVGQLVALRAGAVRNQVCGVRSRLLGALDGELSCLGRDRPAFREHDPEGLTVGSISNERTFRADLGDVGAVEAQLLALVERTCWRARRRGVRARTVSIKLRHADFDTVQRSMSSAPTAEDEVVLMRARELLFRAWDRHRAVRLIGVALTNLVGQGHQLALPFADDGPRPSSAVDAVRERFGFDAIRRGRTGSGRQRPG